MARPTKRTPKLEAAILNALRAGMTRTAAFDGNGVHHSQAARWMARSAAFRTAVMEAEAAAEVRATITLRQAGETDWKAALAWLERRRPDDWARHDRVELISSVRDLARREGWSGDEEALAVEEVERMLRTKRGQG